MLEMKCPGCGAGGRVPRDKKNNTARVQEVLAGCFI